MNKEDLVKLCIIDNDAIPTQPFKNNYNDMIVMRHNSNNKWFALIFELKKKLLINLKCQPELLMVLIEQYEAISPAWHMNKKHWCTIDVNNISIETLNKIINISYDITSPKKKKQK